jgi:hypothetical protein
LTSPSLAHVDRLLVKVRPLVKEDAPVVEATDQVVLPPTPVTYCTVATRGQRHRWHLPPPPRAWTKLLSLSTWTARYFDFQTDWFLRLAP